MKPICRNLLISMILFGGCFAASAQKPGHEQRMEYYRSMKIAYFTENLALSPEEAEKFWPLYNQHEKEKAELRKNQNLHSRAFAEKADQLTEEEAEKIIDKHMENRQKELQMDMDFHSELKKILPATKIMKLYITEVRFREHMLREIRERHNKPDRGYGKQIP